jgi:hypothetical protein
VLSSALLRFVTHDLTLLLLARAKLSSKANAKRTSLGSTMILAATLSLKTWWKLSLCTNRFTRISPI